MRIRIPNYTRLKFNLINDGDVDKYTTIFDGIIQKSNLSRRVLDAKNNEHLFDGEIQKCGFHTLIAASAPWQTDE